MRVGVFRIAYMTRNQRLLASTKRLALECTHFSLAHPPLRPVMIEFIRRWVLSPGNCNATPMSRDDFPLLNAPHILDMGTHVQTTCFRLMNEDDHPRIEPLLRCQIARSSVEGFRASHHQVSSTLNMFFSIFSILQ